MSPSTSMSPMPSPTWSTWQRAPSGATRSSRRARASGNRGRWGHSPRKASAPRRTAFPASPTTRSARGTAPPWPPTATWSCGAATTDSRSAAPCASKLRRVRFGHQRQAVDPDRAERFRRAARRGQHGIPRTHDRPAERDQCADPARTRHAETRRQRHGTVHVRGGGAARRPSAPARNVAQRHGRSGRRQRSVHAHGGLLPRGHRGPSGALGGASSMRRAATSRSIRARNT